MTYSCVLFDFGGVFVDSPFPAVRTYAADEGHDPDRVVQAVFGAYDRDDDHPWHRLERGELGFFETREAILASSTADGMPVDLFDVFRALRGSTVREPMIELTRDLRAAGVRVGLITNNVKDFGGGWRSMLPVDELFEVVVDSSQVGYRKPDPRIYHHALTELGGIEPAASIFLDDFPGNVVAAEAVGIRGILVGDDYEVSIAEVRQLTLR